MPKSRIVIGYKMVKIDLKSALIDENTFLSSCSKYQELWPVQYKTYVYVLLKILYGAMQFS